MAAHQLPAKLKKEPLADAIFEIRFTSAIPGSNIIPGALASRLGTDDPKFERLPASDIPSRVRDMDPSTAVDEDALERKLLHPDRRHDLVSCVQDSVSGVEG